MKKLYSLIFFLSFGVSFICQAQNKTAHLNYKLLFESVPAYKQAEDSLIKLRSSYEAELVKMENEYKLKTDAFAKDSAQMQTLIKEQKRKEIKAIEENYVSFRESAQKDIDAKRTALIDPLVAKIKESIAAVAKEKGYAYVIDDNTQGYIYMSETDNIMEAVKKKLGLSK